MPCRAPEGGTVARSHGERGNAAAEFALVAGLLAVFILASFDLSVAVTAHTAVMAAAREGARQAAIDGGDTPAVRQRVAEMLSLASLSDTDATVRVEPRQAGYGRPIRVTVAVAYRPRTPLLRRLADGEFMLRGQAVTRNERVP